MEKMVGKVINIHNSTVLKYYLTGSRRDGYSVSIIQKNGTEQLYAKCENITRSAIRANDLFRKLSRGMVFPEQLPEIVADQI